MSHRVMACRFPSLNDFHTEPILPASFFFLTPQLFLCIEVTPSNPLTMLLEFDAYYF